MLSKKGISPVIAWVLIVGFTMVLGLIVSNWYIQQSKATAKSALGSLESSIECNDIKINVAFIRKPDASECWLKVSNTGMLKIAKVKINGEDYVYERNPKEYWNYTKTRDIPTLCDANLKVTVLPILETDKDLITCNNDRIYESKAP